VSAADRFAPAGAATYGEPPVDVTALYEPTTAYQVIGLSQETRIRPRDQKLIPTIAVSLTVPPFPGVFIIRIDNYAFTHADPIAYLNERAYLIRSLYALPERLPPYVEPGSYASGVYVVLDSASATTLADGSGAVAWSGQINPRGVAATARVEILALGEPDPTLVSDPIDVAASQDTVPLSGTVGPLDPGKYTVQLTASSSLGIGLSILRVVTIL
jgi:hypothetical protein